MEGEVDELQKTTETISSEISSRQERLVFGLGCASNVGRIRDVADGRKEVNSRDIWKLDENKT